MPQRSAADPLAAAASAAPSPPTASDAPAAATVTPPANALEVLREELQLELAPPRKLLRQFSLNVPPSSAGLTASSTASPSAFRSAVLARKLLPHAPPAALGGVLERWERNHRKWRRLSASQGLADAAAAAVAADDDNAALDSSMQQQQFEDDDDDSNALLLPPLLPPLVVMTMSDNDNSVIAAAAAAAVAAEPDAMQGVPYVRAETFEVTFGHGYLGLEFAVDETRGEVVVKSVQPDAPPESVLQIPPFTKIARGLIVDAVNGHDVRAPEEALELLQFSARPLVVRFRRSRDAIVVCKLCECKVDATNLSDHTNYCVMSKRFELEADQINTALTKLADSIHANLQTDALRSLFHQEDLHFYNALRVVAIQASSCDATSVASFALCSRLLKIVDRIRQQEHETSSFAVERGLKYCISLRTLIHTKMSKMRATQKMILQQAPSDMRAPFHRTKSLEEKENVVPLGAPHSSARRLSACRVSIRDFQIVKPISKGAYGKVYLARKKTTGDQYAVKVLAKEHLLRKKQKLESIETERDILVNIESPYVVKLFWTFQSRRNLFLVMEYLPGGDFMSLLECIVQLEEQVARVYVAEVALALNHLHSKGCVHRDLKPDNILISSTGHIKLTDFGLSEEAVHMSDSDTETAQVGFFGELDEDAEDDITIPSVLLPTRGAGETPELFGQNESISAFFDASRPRRRSSKQQKQKQNHTHTFGRCGTPDYLSPEIILGVQHGPPVDYWALGIILYEMLVGFPPFNDDTVEAIFNNILDRQILWPDGEKCLSPDAIDLISKLLEPDPALRLGWEGLRNHQFFDGIDWDTLLDTVPPFVPTLEGPTDTSYFNNRNLTDIFIDDDDFDFDANSVDSSSMADMMEGGGAAGDAFSSSGGDPELANRAASVQSNSDAASESVSFLDSESAIQAAVLQSRSDTSGIDCDGGAGGGEGEGETGDMFDEDNISSNWFPGGSSDEVALTEAFRSFSFTNMNALAAASRTEAEKVITHSLLQEAESSSALSIRI